MATAMDLEKLAQSIKSGQHVLKQHDSKKSKSKCWETFRDVIDDDGNLVFGVACCSLCYACITYKKQDGSKVIDFGTKNLLDHADKCGSCDKTGRKQSTMTAFVTRSKPLVAKADKDKLRQNESLFIAGCQLAFNVVDTAHFRRMCQNLIQIGAKYGNVSAMDVLVGRKTVRADIVKLAESVKST